MPCLNKDQFTFSFQIWLSFHSSPFFFFSFSFLIALARNSSEAPLMLQMVKNLPAMQETWFWSLGCGDLLEKGMAAHSGIFASGIPWTQECGGSRAWGCKELDTTEQLTHTHKHRNCSTTLNASGKTSLIWGERM